jgi:hypothetical protein
MIRRRKKKRLLDDAERDIKPVRGKIGRKMV